MMWKPWRRKHGAPSVEACEAVRQADRAYEDAERLDDAVSNVADRLRKTTARNHFREAVEQAMRRHA